MQPSPSHLAMRTPKSVATLRTPLRNSVSTRTDSSSPNSSPNDVKPERSTNANHRSTLTASILASPSHQTLNEAHYGIGDPTERVIGREAARFQWLEAVIAGFDPTKGDRPLNFLRVAF